ncbi:hypothetical protein EYF80_016447 [Liparis tanakae]|uniref:Uncharacterized protein n=1 Tax=Liparis tanakae TaxID=230148 RepID=A0A4Z2I7J1_9TELE|nr:hypothetical protein EYF80_016447 [Liparis tanakae]
MLSQPYRSSIRDPIAPASNILKEQSPMRNLAIVMRATVSKGRLFWGVKGQKGECSLHLCQTVAALLSLLSQLRLGKLQR